MGCCERLDFCSAGCLGTGRSRLAQLHAAPTLLAGWRLRLVLLGSSNVQPASSWVLGGPVHTAGAR